MMWQTMFISIKRKVSSTLITTIILAILILVVSYLAKHVVMGELEEVITCTDMMQRGWWGQGSFSASCRGQ